ncbi:DUF4062 domain-containing protein [Haliscomenobacter sp.]|uniref:DUF4062 domain-containing protein n=1 Tax=Haliscomenobacter sp. TaxID=2717303 RepID=UPI003BAC8E79
MPSTVIKVYLSSTWLDLKDEREAVERAINRLPEVKFIGMEYFGSRGENTKEASLEDIEPCDLYIGLLGPRYGSGIVEAEYERAQELGKPCLWYVMDEKALAKSQFETDDPDRLKAFLKLISDNHLRSTFSDPGDLAARVVTDMHTWLQGHFATGLRTVTEGVESLPYDYSARIENFLNEYLGTEQQPVAFGGRGEELDMLTDWLNDEEQTPYMLLAAPAGKGKSALLVHWSKLMHADINFAIVFMPVSIRFRTNLSGVFFASLAARLAKLYGEEIKESSSQTVETWRGLIAHFLRRPLPDGRKLLVIIDGIDEAADWQAGADLFPNNPPKQVKILISARYVAEDTDATQWLDDLGWNRNRLATVLGLKNLSSSGLQSVMDSMGFPVAHLSRNVDILKELFRLTEGDPLVIQLYLNDLWQNREQATNLTPEDLKEIEPGLEGYFKRWWKEQKSLWKEQKKDPLKIKAVRGMLDLLAFAIGPLKKEEIIQLVEEDWELNSTILIEEALEPLARFVIGDGNKQGYVFSHSRLGYYFFEQTTVLEKERWEARYLNWGKWILDNLYLGDLKPKDVPVYLIQYFGAHLSRGNEPLEERMKLVHRAWSEAWESLEGTKAGFLNDVARAKLYARQLNGQFFKEQKPLLYLGQEITCMLAEASIRSLAANIPNELPALLLQTGKWTSVQILAHVRQLPDDNSKVSVLKSIFNDLNESWREEGLAAAFAIQDESARAKILAELASCLNQQELGKVLAAASAIQDGSARAMAFAGLIPYLDQQDKVLATKAALEAALAIQGDSSRATALALMAPDLYLDRQGMAKALEVVSGFGFESEVEHVLRFLAPHLNQEGLEKALEIALLIEGPSRASILTRLSEHLNPPGKFWVAREALKALSDGFTGKVKSIAELKELVAHLDPQGITEALKFVLSINDEKSKATAFRNLAPHLDQDGLVQVMAATVAIKDESCRVTALTSLIPYLDEDPKTQAIHSAVETFFTIPDEFSKVLALEDLTLYLDQDSRAKATTETLNAVLSISNQSYRASALKSLIPLLDRKDHTQVIKAAFDFHGPEQVSVLRKLVPHLDQYEVVEVMKVALETPYINLRTDALRGFAPHLNHEAMALSIETLSFIEEDDQANIIRGLAPHLDQQELSQVLAKSLAIQNDSYRTEALTCLARYLDQDKANAVEAALNAASTIHDESSRANLLKNLAQFLDHPDNIEAARAALKAASAIQNDQYSSSKSDALKNLAPFLYQIGMNIEFALAFQDDFHRPKALISLAPNLDKQDLEKALEVILGIHHEPFRANYLVDLAPNLSQAGINQVLEAVLAFHSEYAKARAIGGMARYLDIQANTQMLEVALSMEEEINRALALLGLIPFLLQQDKVEAIKAALDAALLIQVESYKTSLLTDLIPYLDKKDKIKVIKEALEAVSSMHSSQREPSKADLLTNLIRHLDRQDMDKVLQATLSIQDSSNRADVLIFLAPHLDQEGKEKASKAALEAVLDIDDGFYKTSALHNLVPYLDQQSIELALDCAIGIQDEYSKADALKSLAPRLDKMGLERALEGTLTIQYGYHKGHAIKGLAPYLDQQCMERALIAAYAIQDGSYKIEAIIGLAPYLDRQIIEQVLASFLTIQEESLKEKAFTGLAPYLDRFGLSQLLRDAIVFQSEGSKAEVLTGLAPYLDQHGIAQALEAALGMQDQPDGSSKAKLLTRLAPFLDHQGVTQALEAALAIHDELSRAKALIGLAPYLDQKSLTKALAAGMAFQFKSYRADVLKAVFLRIQEIKDFVFYEELIPALGHPNDVRGTILNRISYALPMVYKLGGKVVMKDLLNGIIKVCQWWP